MVAETRQRSEGVVSRRIAALGFPVAHFLYRAPRTIKGERKVSPLFEKYVLFQTKRGLDPARVFSVRGVMNVLNGLVRDSIVQEIRSRENAMGYVVVSEEEPPVFDLRQNVVWKGDGVAINGIYLGSTSRQRSQVLLAMMGKELSIEVQTRELAAA
jgi:hypothetical protein